MPIEKTHLKQYVDQLPTDAVILVEYGGNYFYVESLEISDAGDLIIHCDEDSEEED